MTEQSIGELASNIVDPWAWWQKALAEPGKIGTADLPVHPSSPQQGYYRTRYKGGDWEPVALWSEEGIGWIGYRSGQEVSDVEKLWTFCCREPITYDQYERAMAGDGWADEPPKPPTAGIGHNSGDADPFDAIKIELLGEVETAADMLKAPIKTKDQADKLAIWIDRIKKLKKKADDVHQVEKAPWLEGGRKVDARRNEIRDKAEEELAKLIGHLNPYRDELARQERERAEKARREAEAEKRRIEEERRKEEAARREAEEKADVASMPSQEELDEQERQREQARKDEERRLRELEKEAEEKNINFGRTGARVSTRKVKVGIVDDWEAAALALVRMKHSVMMETIQTLANRAAKSDMAFDGMHIDTEERM